MDSRKVEWKRMDIEWNVLSRQKSVRDLEEDSLEVKSGRCRDTAAALTRWIVAGE